MSRYLNFRRAGVLAVATGAATLGVTTPALADVTVSPPSAVQGNGENITFRVTNTEQSAVTAVKLSLPQDTPIAEVYPLSVDDWAPSLTNRHLSTPLATIHGGTPTTETASAVTWTAMSGHALAPGKTADLTVALGPLPSLSQMQFTVQLTYAQGAGKPVPPLTLRLTPATGEAAAGAHGHDTAAPATGSDAEDAAFAAVMDSAGDGTSPMAIAGWVLAAVLGLGGLIAAGTMRHRRDLSEPEPDGPEPAGEAGEDEDRGKEPVGAAAGPAKGSGWRYRETGA